MWRSGGGGGFQPVTRPGRGGDLETAGAGGAVEHGKKERGDWPMGHSAVWDPLVSEGNREREW
jgi:hypothetical protein